MSPQKLILEIGMTKKIPYEDSEAHSRRIRKLLEESAEEARLRKLGLMPPMPETFIVRVPPPDELHNSADCEK